MKDEEELVLRLFRSLSNTRPDIPKQFPVWDLKLVLGVLVYPPFEPV